MNKLEYRNPKWFDQLTTPSQVEGQIQITKAQMSEILTGFEHWKI
jgi:hypothetical protein